MQGAAGGPKGRRLGIKVQKSHCRERQNEHHADAGSAGSVSQQPCPYLRYAFVFADERTPGFAHSAIYLPF